MGPGCEALAGCLEAELWSSITIWGLIISEYFLLSREPHMGVQLMLVVTVPEPRRRTGRKRPGLAHPQDRTARMHLAQRVKHATNTNSTILLCIYTWCE